MGGGFFRCSGALFHCDLIAGFIARPGWWEGGTPNHLLINQAKWNELPKNCQSIIVVVAGAANIEQTARYDGRNSQALRRLVANGVQLRPFSTEIMDACLKASNEVNAEESAKNVNYKKVLADMEAYRNL
ncbi:hypothetical protein [Undibacter mobilis]|uniref:hypothetical protein n=1 Tax=Undibacter mobilis TaxID=2292256 RepID=UPI00143D8C50|nr:hypothetical protein [Undibacter mobilis]